MPNLIHISINNEQAAENKLSMAVCDATNWMDDQVAAKIVCLIAAKKCDIRRVNDMQCFSINGGNVNISNKVKDLGVITKKH